MGKVFKNKECSKCGKNGNVIEVWGIYYCKECWDKKPKTKNGHSGMIKLDRIILQDSVFKEDLVLEKTKKGNPIFSTLYLTHYPKSKGIVGRQFNYFIRKEGKIFGIIGGNSPPLNYKIINEYFGEQFNEKNWLNNNVFRLIKHERNLGTKVLKLFRKTIKHDYENKYKDSLMGLITFIEPPRTGSVYKADNWNYLGMTQGKSCKMRNHWNWINKEWSDGVQKHIYVKKLKGHIL